MSTLFGANSPFFFFPSHFGSINLRRNVCTLYANNCEVSHSLRSKKGRAWLFWFVLRVRPKALRRCLPSRPKLRPDTILFCQSRKKDHHDRRFDPIPRLVVVVDSRERSADARLAVYCSGGHAIVPDDLFVIAHFSCFISFFFFFFSIG